MQKFYYALDLQDDPDLIQQYIDHHKKVWPEIIKSIRESGILNMEIFHVANRLFMIIETNDSFSFEKKNTMDAENIKVQEWEDLMWKFQKALPNAIPGTKWQPMDSIFKLSDYKS
jgi:L-rhamnose mutarotase